MGHKEEAQNIRTKQKAQQKVKMSSNISVIINVNAIHN